MGLVHHEHLGQAMMQGNARGVDGRQHDLLLHSTLGKSQRLIEYQHIMSSVLCGTCSASRA